MSTEIKEIQHGKQQSFKVDVKIGNSRYYSGSLSINKEGATLEVYGEVIGNECIITYNQLRGENIEYVSCVDSWHLFHLYDLTVFRFNQRTIHGADGRQSFHIVFSVRYFYVSKEHPGSRYQHEEFSSIIFHSPIITKWLGITEKQLRIFRNAVNTRLPTSDIDLRYEFGVDATENISLTVHYKGEWRQDPNHHCITSEYPPYLAVYFRKKYPCFNEIKQITTEILSLFYVLTGQPVVIEKAFLSSSRGTHELPYYFSESPTMENEIRNKDILVPFNTNSPFHKEEEEIFPVEIFKKYFNLNDKGRDIYRKFYIYDNMNNVEEKFLGLFRIVERLSYIESSYVDDSILEPLLDKLREQLTNASVKNKYAKKLTERFRKVNRQKIPAQSAILGFMRSLSDDIYERISHLEKDIIRIVELRNDITHCKSYSLREKEFERFNLILNYLCYLLLWREIGLSSHSKYSGLINSIKYSGLILSMKGTGSALESGQN